MSKSVIIIGAGVAGLSTATYLADQGYEVTVLEKNAQAGGRARKFEAKGYIFDSGPSWYWMPDVFEAYFNSFGKTTSDYYSLKRLSPSYRVFLGPNECIDVPTDSAQLQALFEKIEKGSGEKLKTFLSEAQYKYNVGMTDLVYQPGLSLTEYIDRRILKGVFKLNLFQSFSKYIRKKFKHPTIHRLLEFPILFLGGKPSSIPGLYSLMNYADMVLGTWYPDGGMSKISEAMVRLAKEKGVTICLDEAVLKIETDGEKVLQVITTKNTYTPQIVVGGADYHHIEQQLLKKADRTYSKAYWDTRTLAPSAIIFYLGINKPIKNLLHHNLFFDADFEKQANDIYTNPQFTDDPLFYVCVTSKSDTTVAPPNHENLFVLIPTPPGLETNELIIEQYFQKVIARIEQRTGENILAHIDYRKSYGHQDFVRDYNSFKGNAYGLANTLRQTGILKPKIKSSKLRNLYYTGQLTVPGPGLPPALISGKIVATQIAKDQVNTYGN